MEVKLTNVFRCFPTSFSHSVGFTHSAGVYRSDQVRPAEQGFGSRLVHHFLEQGRHALEWQVLVRQSSDVSFRSLSMSLPPLRACCPCTAADTSLPFYFPTASMASTQVHPQPVEVRVRPAIRHPRHLPCKCPSFPLPLCSPHTTLGRIDESRSGSKRGCSSERRRRQVT